MTRSPSKNRRPGFSLIEVLMSIFILGIGVISIAALFPAAITQQQQSVDDVMGPVVASNALSVIRTKLSQSDFGTFEEFEDVIGVPACPPIGGSRVGSPFGVPSVPPCSRATVVGDWSWLRPAFIYPDALPASYPLGAIDIFNSTGLARSYESLSLALDIPYNRTKYPDESPGMRVPPQIVITQEERYYPQGTTDNESGLKSKPQYVWDCMFRRFNGRVLVAIFVYRVSSGGEGVLYTVADPMPGGDSNPPLPIWLDLVNSEEYSADGAWDANGANDPPGPLNPPDPNLGPAFVHGNTASGVDVFDQREAWQASGQWIIDQNNDVHRVLGVDASTSPVTVELVGPVLRRPALSVYYTPSVSQLVTDIWYLPAIADYGASDARITPVYATVLEL